MVARAVMRVFVVQKGCCFIGVVAERARVGGSRRARRC